jgi:NAD+ synthase (glutamine-hydrolysing)
MPIPPSSRHALGGREPADKSFGQQRNGDEVGLPSRARQAAVGRCLAGYVFASAGQGESTTGRRVQRTRRHSRERQPVKRIVLYGRLVFHILGYRHRKAHERPRNSTASWASGTDAIYRTVAFDSAAMRTSSRASGRRASFIPCDKTVKFDRCRRSSSCSPSPFRTDAEKRASKSAVLGLSGGLDSTLALLVTCEAVRALGPAPVGNRRHHHARDMGDDGPHVPKRPDPDEGSSA